MDRPNDKDTVKEERLKKDLQDVMEIPRKTEIGVYRWSEEGLECLRESLKLNNIKVVQRDLEW